MADDSPSSLIARAAAHFRAGEHFQAQRLCRKILEVDPKNLAALRMLGDLVLAGWRSEVPLAVLTKAAADQPKNADVWISVANVQLTLGMTPQAIASYQRAIVIRPDSLPAHNNLAIALQSAGRTGEYIAVLRRLVAMSPNSAGAYAALATALAGAGQPDQALDFFSRSISLSPSAATYVNYGSALHGTGHRREAIDAFRRAVQMDPTFLPARHNLLYTLLFHPEQTQESIYREHQRWNEIHALPLAHPGRSFDNDRDPDRPLRIGYVSADFCDHVVGRNVLPLFMNHDRGRFHVTCYSNTRSGAGDSMTDCFRDCADQWREIAAVTDAQVAEQIIADRIDILVDLSLHMHGSRLLIFAPKPAPVQVTFAGYPGTTGMTAIDYRLTDPHLDPPGLNDAYYAEKSVRVADSFWVYHVMSDQPAVNELPALKNGFVTFGCLNSFFKLNEIALAWWSRVSPGGCGFPVAALAPPGRHRASVIAALGVSAERIAFVEHQPRQAYLEAYHRIDIGLDTFPYNGHTTSLDALWMGVPVVSLYGQPAVSRAGLSQATNLGLTELTADNPDECVRIATALAADLPRLAEMRRGLRGRMAQSPLMDDKRFTQNIENAYLEMWRTWREG